MTVDEAFHLAFQHQQAGRLGEADSICRQILAHNPNYSDAYRLLCVLANKTGQPQVAVQMMRRAVAIAPHRAEYQLDLGHLLATIGELHEALAALRQAAALRPDWSLAHIKLGNVLFTTGQTDDAIAAFRQAIALEPANAEAHNNLASAWCAQQQWDQGIAAYQAALALRPNWPQAHHNLGKAYYAKGDLNAAITSFQNALAAQPNFPDALFDLANTYQALGRLDEAVDTFRLALAARPDWPQAHNALGLTLTWRAEIDAALGCFNRALAIAPNDCIADSNRLFALNFHTPADAAAILREHRVWEERHAWSLEQAAHSPDRQNHKRLRIGYVSPDFRSHCQALFTVPLLSSHDHDQFEIYCYSSVNNPDAVTARLRGHADAWHDVTAMDDASLAAKIRADGIDILVDLTMHMAHSRMLVFARKPAPLQVAWLAYPGTTGLSAMTARFTDPYLDPPGIGDQFYVEKSIRLPDTFWCYDATALSDGSELIANPLPAETNSYITFGCLNNFCKINAGLLALWSRVLSAVPRSHLLMLAPPGRSRQWTLDQFASHNIDATRIEFVTQQPRQKYVAEYHRIDLGLDTLPYNGHTTSLDSLWMGIPVITRIGPTVGGRAGLSQLSNLGLTDLVAANDDQFVQIATTLAGDLPRLSDLRRTLRDRMRASPLTNAPRFARAIEAAYRQLWAAG